jgi:hypothetical protein
VLEAPGRLRLQVRLPVFPHPTKERSVLEPLVWIQVTVLHALSRRGDGGQTTAEYALVLLGAAAVALLVVAWATKTNKIGQLLNAVIDSVIKRVT